MHIPTMTLSTDQYRHAFDALFRLHDDGADSGYVVTAHEDTKLFWNRSPIARGPRIYDPGIVLIGRGHKIGYQGGRAFRYDADHCLVLSLPSAFESETIASKDEPLIGLFVNVDRLLVLDLAHTIGSHHALPISRNHDAQPSFEPVPLGGDLRGAATRLLQGLADPLEADAIGDALKRELVFRVLSGSGAEGLLALTRDSSVNARVSRALNLLHSKFDRPLAVEDLAGEAGMSVSAFHRGFREVTGESPLQYLKKVRLHRARSLIADGRLRPGEAAREVGYASVSQFSREFSRHFNTPPSALTGLRDAAI